MLQQLFVPVLFLVAVSGKPTEKECELEDQHARNCTSECKIRMDYNFDFENEIPKFEKWVKCVGEPTNIKSCRPPLECEDLSLHVCATDIMKQSDSCSLKDVNTYISTIPDLVRYCNVSIAKAKMENGTVEVKMTKTLPSWGRLQFKAYWYIVDYMLWTPIIGEYLKPYLAMIGFILMITIEFIESVVCLIFR
ncbi:hypothetical protein CRE_21446 [Caenorhabditis remanei]|uniref:Uncharacterized protein n=1 Tax=Caenorhabditis remanei TaxID=31234 RepID=E3N3P0_CAERE|nr:hypothetical protein CRE_21446 [Caenorhabditis remanei]